MKSKGSVMKSPDVREYGEVLLFYVALFPPPSLSDHIILCLINFLTADQRVQFSGT